MREAADLPANLAARVVRRADDDIPQIIAKLLDLRRRYGKRSDRNIAGSSADCSEIENDRAVFAARRRTVNRGGRVGRARRSKAYSSSRQINL
jgi:uncharacterized membrane protein